MAITITILCDKCGAQHSWHASPAEGKVREESLPTGWSERRFLLGGTKVVDRLFCPVCNEKLRRKKEPPKPSATRWEEDPPTGPKTRFAHYDQ